MESIQHALASGLESATTAATIGTLPEALRVTLLETATKLVTTLQKPEDAITKLAYWVYNPLEQV